MLIDFKLSQTGVVLRVKIRNSSVATGAGLTGLTNASTGLIISTIADNEATATAYTAAGSTIDTITTLGTFSAPTAGHCRFKEVDSTNHKGVCEIQIADARFAVSSAKSLLVSISGATNAADCDVLIPLRTVDPYDANFNLQGLNGTTAPTAGALITSGTGTNQLSVSAGKTLLQATQAGVTIPTVTTVTNQLTAAQIATGVWQDATAGDFTTANSIGKSLYTSGNAPGAASGLALVGSNMGTVTSVTGSVGSVTGAVGSVIGNIGGNVVGSVGSVTAAVTLSANDSFTSQSGTAQAGAASTITLASGAIATDNIYNGQLVKINSGTGAGQARVITGYVGSTKVATVDRAWQTNPDATSVYTVCFADDPKTDSSLQVTAASVQGNVTGSVASVTGAVGSVTGNVGGSVASVTGAVGSVTGNVGGNVVGSVGSVTGAVGSVTGAVGSVTAAVSVTGDLSATMKTSVENSVWNATMSSHLTSGTTGASLNGAGSAGDPWNTAIPGSYVAGTAGHRLGNGVPDVTAGSNGGLPLQGGAVPNANAAASGGLPTIGTGPGQFLSDGAGNVSANLSTAATAAVARLLFNRPGRTIWYVDPVSGSDSNAGTLASPFATPLPACVGGAHQASSGDLVIVGPGTVALSASTCIFPDGVSMIGAGEFVTIFNSTALQPAGAIIKPGSNAYYGYFGIIPNNANQASTVAPFGFIDGVANNTIPTNWVADHIFIQADSDCFYFSSSSTTPTQMRGQIRNATVRAKFDSFQMGAGLATAAWDAIVDVFDSSIRSIGPASSGSGQVSRGITAAGGTFRCYRCSFQASGATVTNTGANAQTAGNNSGTIELYGCYVNASGTGANDVTTSGSGVVIVGAGTQYNPNAVTGTGLVLRMNETEVGGYATGQDPASLLAAGSNWLKATGVNAGALNGKGDWAIAGDQMDLVNTPNATALTAAANALLDLANAIDPAGGADSLRKAIRLILASCAGPTSGAGGAALTVKDTTNAKSRIVMQTDASGDRSSPVYDLT